MAQDLQIGRTSAFISEFYQPLHDRGYFFIAPHIDLEHRVTDLYQGSNRIATYDVTSALAGIDIGSQFTRYDELRIGMLGGILSPSLDTGPRSLSPGDDAESVPISCRVMICFSGAVFCNSPAMPPASCLEKI